MKVRKNSPSGLVAENDKETKVAFEFAISNMINGYAGGKAPIYQVEEMPTKEKQAILINYSMTKTIIEKNIKH